MAQFRPFRAQLSPHTSVNLITSIPGTFGVEKGDGDLRRTHEVHVKQAKRVTGEDHVKSSKKEQPKMSDNAQQETTKLECFIDIPQSDRERAEIANEIVEVHAQPLAGSSTSSGPSTSPSRSNSPRLLTRSMPASTSVPSLSSPNPGPSVSPPQAQAQMRTLASLGRIQTQILPSPSPSSQSMPSVQPAPSDNPKRTFSNTSVASAASLAPTEPDIDWDNPTEAEDELGRLGVKIVDFAYTSRFSSGREDKGKGNRKEKEKPFMQPLVQLTTIPVGDLDVGGPDVVGTGAPAGGLPMEDDYIQELLSETVRRESIKRETWKEKADDDEDEEIREWIEEFRDHGIIQAGKLTEEEEEFCEGFGVGSGPRKRKDIEADGGEEDKGKRRRVDETTSSTNITTSASTSTSVSNDNNTPASLSFSPTISVMK